MVKEGVAQYFFITCSIQPFERKWSNHFCFMWFLGETWSSQNIYIGYLHWLLNAGLCQFCLSPCTKKTKINWQVIKGLSKSITANLENDKRPDKQRSTSLVYDLNTIYMVSFMTAQKVMIILQDVGVAASLSTIKRRLHDHNLRGFNTRCKPKLKNRKARLQFAKTHTRKTSDFWIKVLWTPPHLLNMAWFCYDLGTYGCH